LPVARRCFGDQPKPAEVKTQTLTFQQDEETYSADTLFPGYLLEVIS
jgi:hypothetical protein